MDKNIYSNSNLNYTKTIVITGGAGFLGRHLCSTLLKNNHKVICIDNLITGNLKNIEDFKSNELFSFINHDISRELPIEINKDDTHIDEIYNLASLASPEKYKTYPIETIMVNFMGTKNMLDLAKKKHAKFLLTSTSEVYGDPLVHPQAEDYYGNVNTVGARSCYDESKRLAETITYEYNKKFNIDTKIVRIFNTYGPYMDLRDGRVITNFINKINNNEPVEIYGNGEQTRSFCYVDDMIDGLIKMMNSKEHGPINIGNPFCEFTLNQLVICLEKLFKKQIKVNYLEPTENDPKCRKPIIDRAIKYLNWEPKIDIENGLMKTIDYFNSILIPKIQ